LPASGRDEVTRAARLSSTRGRRAVADMQSRRVIQGPTCNATDADMSLSPATESRAAQKAPDVRIDFNVEMPMRDGTILRADIYRPVSDKPVPALLSRGPYDKRIMSGSHVGMDIRAATERGYAVVAQDVRGRFASDGEFLVTPTQAVEGPDGYDSVEWIAAQPWCSGAVGMFGLSYLSLTQWMAAAERPPHLKAIIPEKTGYAPRGAVMLDSILIAWAASQAMDWLGKAMLRQEAGEREAAIIREALTDPQGAALHLPLDDMPLMKIGGLPKFHEMVQLFHGQAGMDVAAVDCPALVVSGWYDMATTETARIYDILRQRAPKDGAEPEANILFGPWDHNTAGLALGEWYFGPFASARMAQLPSLYLDFYDRHLKGDTSKPAPGARYFMMGANEWRASPTWPPPHRAQAVYLHSAGAANGVGGDGRLALDPPTAHSPPDRYRYDPLDPAPSFGGRYFELGGSRPGPYDQRRIEERPDVLVYTGDGLEAPLEIAGPVRLKVFVRCSTPDTDLAFKLCDVHPNGISYNILDEFYRCRWREGYDKSLTFKPGQIYEFDIEMGPIAHQFRAGHRVRLQITSSAFPHFDRNMNTGHAMGVDAEGLIAEVEIFHDAERPTQVVLPVLEQG
jgi:hypothetical protein